MFRDEYTLKSMEKIKLAASAIANESEEPISAYIYDLGYSLIFFVPPPIFNFLVKKFGTKNFWIRSQRDRKNTQVFKIFQNLFHFILSQLYFPYVYFPLHFVSLPYEI